MKNLNQTLNRLNTLIEKPNDKKSAYSNIQIQSEVEEDSPLFDCIDSELYLLAVTWCLGDTDYKERFIERFGHHHLRAFAVKDMKKRAHILLDPVLNCRGVSCKKKISSGLQELQEWLAYHAYNDEYYNLLRQLHESYDESLEQELIRIAPLAGVPNSWRDEDINKCHCKHGIR